MTRKALDYINKKKKKENQKFHKIPYKNSRFRVTVWTKDDKKLIKPTLQS